MDFAACFKRHCIGRVPTTRSILLPTSGPRRAFKKNQDLLLKEHSPPEAAAILMQFITGMQTTQVLGALCRLGVADVVVAEGYTSVSDIARQVGADEVCLCRVMRAAANVGIFQEAPEGRAFKLNSAASLLRSDSPGSLRSIAAFMSMPGHFASTGQLYDTLKTGKPGIQLALGNDFWAAISPEESEFFDQAMVSLTMLTNPAVVASHDWGQYKNIVDVGGGFGAMLGAVLLAHPHLKGQVFDLPQVVAAAPAVPHDLVNRMSYVKGNFFDAVPIESDCYTMKHILHDWSDEESITILNNIKASLQPNGTLVLFESVMPPPGAEIGNGTCWKDVLMLSVTTGKERTAEEWEDLVGRAGFKLHHIQPLQAGDLYAIVCKPI